VLAWTSVELAENATSVGNNDEALDARATGLNKPLPAGIINS
jgi:hypothetical protein